MATHTLHFNCILNATVKEVCSFHTDTRNLPLITPPWIDVKILAMDTPMIQHSRVVLDIKRFGISTRWEMEIEEMKCPQCVTDVMVSGPFKTFRHERRFIPIDQTQTRMNETITLTLPMEWLGNIIFPFIKKDMESMFDYRHRATQSSFWRETMFYLYDKTLKILRLEAKEAVEIARFCNSILVTNKIEEAILIADYPKSALLLYPRNRYTLFRYCSLQLRHRTLKEFRIILYAAETSWLYYLLKTASLLSFGYYRFIPFKKSNKQ